MTPRLMRLAACLALAAITLSPTTLAQQAQEFDGHTVHYNALSTSELTPEVAQAYGIRRSSNRALLNITVLAGTEPVAAAVTATARNLTGQNRDIEMRRIDEGGEAIYYIGEFRVNNMETFDFRIAVTPEGSSETLDVRFRRQFYTE